MQELARDRSTDMHSFFVTAQHTAQHAASARRALGADPLLVPEQAVVVESDPTLARRRAREHVTTRLVLANYVNHLRALGFGDSDLADDGSDDLVAPVARGGPADVARRVEEHLTTGADHVAVHPLAADDDPLGLAQLRSLAAALHLAPAT